LDVTVPFARTSSNAFILKVFLLFRSASADLLGASAAFLSSLVEVAERNREAEVVGFNGPGEPIFSEVGPFQARSRGIPAATPPA
jgi:hypothetical protein